MTEVLLQGLLSGLLMGLVYALVASGLTLIFGLMELVNFSHGEFLMLAMFATFFLWLLLGFDPLVSVPIAALLLALLGVLSYRVLVRRLLRGPMLAQVFGTFGLAIFLRGVAQLLFTPDFRVIQKPLTAGPIWLGAISMPMSQVVAGLGALAAFGLLYWFISSTETGVALRATAQDRDAAALMGIDVQRMFVLGWAIGAACVGVAGALLAAFYPVFPDVGALFALLAYVAVALGGFGSILGALVAGVVIGLVEHLGGLLFIPAFKYVLVFLIYLLVVQVRPTGLFGRF